MHLAMQRRIAVVMHDPVYQVLSIPIESGGAPACFNEASGSLYQSKYDEAATVICQSNYRFSERSFIIARIDQIKPVLDLTIEIFARPDQ